MTRENSRVHTVREGIGSTHRGILGTYTTNFGVNNTSSKVEHGSQSRGYNLPKALCIRGKAHKVIVYEGRCRIEPHKGSGGSHGIWCEHHYSTKSRKNARISDYRNNGLIQCSNAKGIMISKMVDQKKRLWSKTSKLNRHRSTINQGLIFRTPAHVRGDVWAEGENSNCDRRLRAFTNLSNQMLEIPMTKDANEYC